MLKRRSRKPRRHQPSRQTLDESINAILDKAVNADSKNAPKQLHLILTSEHPEWKLPERRVAKYLKRQLKERNNPMYNDIDADLDEASIYSSTSSSTWRTKDGAEIVNAASTDSGSYTTGMPSPAKSEKEEEEAAIATDKELLISAYEVDPEDEKPKDKPLFCDGCDKGCVIS